MNTVQLLAQPFRFQVGGVRWPVSSMSSRWEQSILEGSLLPESGSGSGDAQPTSRLCQPTGYLMLVNDMVPPRCRSAAELWLRVITTGGGVVLVVALVGAVNLASSAAHDEGQEAQ